MNRYSPTSLTAIYINAMAVADSSQILVRTSQEATRSEDLSTAVKTVIGSTVLGAFAIEMLFKAITAHLTPDNSFASGHFLKDLFAEIPCESTRDSISSQYSAVSENTLQSFLDEQNCAFGDWRYLCERSDGRSVRPQQFSNLIEILKSHLEPLNDTVTAHP